MASAKELRTLGPYAVTASLGEGGYSKVKLGVHVSTGEKVALKVLKNFSKMDKSSLKQLEREFNALSKLDHENVLKMKDYLTEVPYKAVDGRETAVNVFVLELAPNGELFDFISSTGSFEENVARTFFHQLIAGLEHCHSKGVYHRDIKPENLLLGEDYVLKIADFGLSNAIQNSRGEALMHTICGTTYYQAPELAPSAKGYDPAPVDIWACGVVLFVLLSRSPPYETTKMSDWYYNKLATNKHALFWRAHSRSAYFSEQSKDFINKILHPDPTKRLTIADMKKHPWWSGPTVSKESLQAELTTRMKVVWSVKESARQDQKGVQDEDVVRGEGGAVSAADDELPAPLPSFGIEPVLLKNPIHAPLSDDLAFSDDDFKRKWIVAQLPAGIERYTRFRAKAGLEPGYIISRIVEVLIVKKCKYSISKDDSARLTVEVGPANFAIELFADPDSKKSDAPDYIVDFRRKVGADMLFRAAYADLRASLGDVVAQPRAADVAPKKA